MWRRLAVPGELSSTAAFTLARLSRDGPCRLTELAAHEKVSQPAMTQLVSRLEGQGSIFQTNSDTEVIVHLIALSKEHTLPEAMADALRRVEGAFSLVMMSTDRIFAARDPRG